ncbi:MAG TPA: hypothetical protein VG603_05970 [Chitinophagales bacterium]|nr:hypothetical protein [Chitinophagales bacterium]
MKRMVKYFPVMMLMLAQLNATAQDKGIVYHPCFLMDSVDTKLDFIIRNASRVFVDTFECKQTLMDSIGSRYLDTKENKYLDALVLIKQNPYARVEGLYTDLVKRFCDNDFQEFVGKLYMARGRYLPLENELIAALNMIVNGRPLKQKYMGLLNVEIEKAADAKDKAKEYYLQRLKTKIEEEKYR